MLPLPPPPPPVDFKEFFNLKMANLADLQFLQKMGSTFKPIITKMGHV